MNKKLSLSIAALLSAGALLAACGDKAATTGAAPEQKPAETAAASQPATTTTTTTTTTTATTEAAATASTAAAAPAPAPTAAPVATSTVTSLQSTDTSAGTGAEAVSGKAVAVHYTGWLYDESAADKHGTKFDSSVDRGEPFEFTLGNKDVIQGWDEGVVGMKVGGKRTLVIPASMAYGETGAGGGLIPPNATLVFDVELLEVK